MVLVFANDQMFASWLTGSFEGITGAFFRFKLFLCVSLLLLCKTSLLAAMNTSIINHLRNLLSKASKHKPHNFIDVLAYQIQKNLLKMKYKKSFKIQNTAECRLLSIARSAGVQFWGRIQFQEISQKKKIKMKNTNAIPQ